MAVVKQSKLRLMLDPEKPWLETVVKVKYDNTDGRYRTVAEDSRFYVELPEVVANALGKKEVRAGTQQKALDEFEQAIKSFKAMNVETTRVILYRLTLYPHPFDEEKNKWNVRGGLNVCVTAGVYDEKVTTAGDGSRRYFYEYQPSSLDYPDGRNIPAYGYGRQNDHCDCQVPWSEKNEAFFRWIAEQMGVLIEALAKLDDPANLIEMINTGRLLPLGAGQAGEKE